MVVDQDVNDAGLIHYPTSDATRATVRVAPADASVITGKRKPTAVLPPLPRDSQPEIRAALGHILDLLEEHRFEPNLAAQWARVVERAMSPLAPRGRLVFATAISRTPGFETLLAAICHDPVRCALLYNQAAAAVPRARVAPLVIHGESAELPLWRIDPASGVRRPAYSSDLHHADPATLAPRALLLTAFMRLFVCDLFVHGIGGGLYDTITDGWIRSWMPQWTLAPTTVVSATLHVPMPQAANVPRPEEISHARWLAHSARHDPLKLEDSAAALKKQALLHAIESQRGDRPARASLYRELHAVLAQSRDAHAVSLKALADHAAQLEESTRRSEVVFDRTWPFVFHSQHALAALGASIRRAITGS